MNKRFSAAGDRGRLHFLARCIRGIEWIAAAEIDARLAPARLAVAHREVRFSSPFTPSLEALRLAAADDVFLVVGDAEGLDHTRASLARIREAARRLPWADALGRLQRMRPDAAWRGMSISASALGRRNYSRYEVEDAVADGAASALGLRHRPSLAPRAEEAELAIRVHLAADRATLALRVFDAPLHRRAYKLRSCAGTLHPPLAAAMAMLAGARPGARMLDPFAGVGTIAIEAARLQPSARVVGTDIDHARLMDAAANARAAGVRIHLAHADAARLPCEDGAFDRVIGNVPWDRAVAVQGRLAAAPDERDRELARVLDGGGRAVLLLRRDDPLGMRGAPGLTLLHRSWLSVSGQQPRLCVLAREDAVGMGRIDLRAPWGLALERHLRHADTVEV